MEVEVIFKGGNRGYVDRNDLDMLINSKLVTSFKRSTGWVRIGDDPMRQKLDIAYGGEEKRTPH